MKKKMTAAVFMAVIFAQNAFAADITVKINGSAINFDDYDDARPYISDDRVMIPVRAVAENMGADVWWNAKTYEVSVNDNIVFQIGKRYAYINDEPVELDTPAVIRDDRAR